MASRPILRDAVINDRVLRDERMISAPSHCAGVDSLLTRIQCASEPDAQLFTDAVAIACLRSAAMRKAGHGDRLDRLIEAGAWTDAAFALVELELPYWTARRIACDDGQWHCRLSAQPWLPDGFDDVIETFHDALPLAILAAVVEARRQR